MRISKQVPATVKFERDEDTDWNLWLMLYYVRDIISKSRVDEVKQYGITLGEAGFLFTVQALGYGATPAEISRRMFRQPHSISELLDRMERKGLVSRVKDLDRKNLVRVVLTEKGQKVYHQSARREPVHRIMSSLSEEERQHLRACLQKLWDKAIEDLGVLSKPPVPWL